MIYSLNRITIAKRIILIKILVRVRLELEVKLDKEFAFNLKNLQFIFNFVTLTVTSRPSRPIQRPSPALTVHHQSRKQNERSTLKGC